MLALLISSLSVAAQTVTGYCVKYDKQHWVYQKDGQVNVIDINVEWPLAASSADIAPLQTFLAKNVFDVEGQDYADIVERFKQRFGSPVTKPFDTLPDDSAFCYVNARATLIGYRPGQFITLSTEYDCSPLPRSKQSAKHLSTIVTYDIAKGKVLLMKDIIKESDLDHIYEYNAEVLFIDDNGTQKTIVIDGAGLGEKCMIVSDIYQTHYQLSWSFARDLATSTARKLMEKKSKPSPNKRNYTMSNTMDGKTIYEHPDKSAAFTYGGMKVKDYLIRNLQIPENPIGQDNEHPLVVSIVINENGEVADVSVIDHGSPDLDREVVRVIKAMPRWEPAIVNGQKVCSRIDMPIVFKQ